MELILSHKPLGAEGVYLPYRHLKEMKAAFELWEEYLIKIVSGELEIELAV
jgi:hypothetical protein